MLAWDRPKRKGFWLANRSVSVSENFLDLGSCLIMPYRNNFSESDSVWRLCHPLDCREQADHFSQVKIILDIWKDAQKHVRPRTMSKHVHSVPSGKMFFDKVQLVVHLILKTEPFWKDEETCRWVWVELNLA